MQVRMREGESFDSLLKRFKSGVAREAILSQFRRSQAFISKGERKRIKMRKAARRRMRKAARRAV